MDQSVKYGLSLPDQVDTVANLFDAHLGCVADLRDLYRDRAVLEREYAGKLQLLVKRIAEKRSKAATSLVVGDNPVKPCGEGTLDQNTFNHTFSQIISAMSSTVQEHTAFADRLVSEVVDPLKVLGRRGEDHKKKQVQFHRELLSERDRYYHNRLKCKRKYDDDCANVEVYRQKKVHSQQDRNADRAVRQYEQQRSEMLITKNMYLLSIVVANRVKAKYYQEDLPSLEDMYQDLQTRLVKGCVDILKHAQDVQTTHQDTLKDCIIPIGVALNNVQPVEDQRLFIVFNLKTSTIPGDWSFEACATYYDTDDMCLEATPKIFLQNTLSRSRTRLQEAEATLSAKGSEVEKHLGLVAAYSTDNTVGNVDDAVSSYLEVKRHATLMATSVLVLRSEIGIIIEALGGEVGGLNPHTFKTSSFSIPTTCGYCNSSIWGLRKLGKTCKACGLSVHAHCEFKVPAECTGVSGDPKAAGMEPPSEPLTSSRTENTPSFDDFAEAAVRGNERRMEHTPLSAVVIFDFYATSPFELSVSEGSFVNVLEEDDGSGWVKVTDGNGTKGLVPASYLEISKTQSSESSGTPEQTSSGQFAHVLYDYQAQGPYELSIVEGETLRLSSGPNGGQSYAEGWWEGYSSCGKKGIFPSNYVEIV